MGRGNTCAHGKYEGLYYADRDYIDCYISREPDEDGCYDSKLLEEMSRNDFDNYDYDDCCSASNYEWFIQEFTSKMKKRFKSLECTGKDFGVIMENRLFEIEIEDNEWSYAVKLLQKESDYYDNYSMEGLQAKHYKNYLNAIKEVLLELFPSIGCYGGAWTHGTIRREEVFA